jgi:chaperonin GroES
MAKVKLLAVKDKIIVRPDEVETKTPGGIVLPDNAKDKPSTGSVVAAPEDTDIKVGNTVFYSAYVGGKIKWENEELTVIRIEDILAYHK